MHLVLIGADYEENLGLGIVAALAEEASWTWQVVPFNDPSRAPEVVTAALRARPDVIGLGIQFQHRAHEFLSLSRRLRAAGFLGHITCGGQWPSQAWRETLAPRHGIDSVTLYEAEGTFPTLLTALAAGEAWQQIPGLAYHTADGVPARSEPRGLTEDLDAVPFPKRYRPHDLHFGVPFIPVMGSRGCWGHCAYCSITSGHRDAHSHGGGKRLRRRTPSNLATEMAALWHRAGGPSIFCLHDDNMLDPKPAGSMARLTALREELDALGVSDLGLVGKCRPDSLTPELAKWLAAQGVLRLYVGVENASEAGSDHLGRGTQGEHVEMALRACREAGIFVCYNLLLFEPKARLQDLSENIAFIRAHPDHPVNFCRAEPYYGTPLMTGLAEERNLSGSYLGYDYRILDDRTELAFRTTSAIFRDRNFSAHGVANRYMGLGYALKVLERFYDHEPGQRERLAERAQALTRKISLETADLLEEVLLLVEQHQSRGPGWFEGAAAHLGLRIGAIDGRRHRELDQIFDALSDYAAAAARARKPLTPPPRLARLTRAMALGATLAVGSMTTACEDETMVLDPVPYDGGLRDGGPNDAIVVDPLPADAGRDAGPVDSIVVDPPPPDAGRDAGEMDAIVVDPLPPDSGLDAGAEDVPVVDPPPPDAGLDAGILDVPPVDPAPPDAGVEDVAMRTGPMDKWRDTAPRRSRRSADLPLYEAPQVELTAHHEGGAITATARVGSPASLRWQARGRIEGETETIRWFPADDHDRLVVAVRSASGLALASVRAKHVS